jgi:CBS domain-containing protein
MFNERVRRMMAGEHLMTAMLQTSARDAAKMMADAGGGVVLVMDGDRLAGIFTSRDAAMRVLAAGRDAALTSLADVMTGSPITVSPDQPFGYALQLMQMHGVRHLPVVENGRPVGVVTTRNALDPELEDFSCEAVRREGFRAPERTAN